METTQLYKVKLQSDKGTHIITTSATSERDARLKICKAEKCPDTTVIKVKLIKN